MDQYWKLFVEIWQSNDNVQAVAEALSKSKNAVNKDAMKLRKMGVKLKEYRPGGLREGRPAPDVEALNNLIGTLGTK